MNNLTNGERVAYAHGRVKEDMRDAQETMTELRREVDMAYRAWLTVLIGGLAVLTLAAIPLFVFPHLWWYCITYITISILTFVIGRLISFHKIRDVMRVVKLVGSVVNSLSDTQTLRLGFEDIRQENIENKAKQDGTTRTD